MRFIGELPWRSETPREPFKQLWIRADGRLNDDPLLHACVAAYASDMSLFDTILAPHPFNWQDGTFMGASLDHCMWFHRPFRADEWLLYDVESPSASGARGLVRGRFFDRGGRLVASAMQEGLIRRRSR
jgi:acyl-CoA thioesterase-2